MDNRGRAVHWRGLGLGFTAQVHDWNINNVTHLEWRQRAACVQSVSGRGQTSAALWRLRSSRWTQSEAHLAPPSPQLTREPVVNPLAWITGPGVVNVKRVVICCEEFTGWRCYIKHRSTGPVCLISRGQSWRGPPADKGLSEQPSMPSLAWNIRVTWHSHNQITRGNLLSKIGASLLLTAVSNQELECFPSFASLNVPPVVFIYVKELLNSSLEGRPYVHDVKGQRSSSAWLVISSAAPLGKFKFKVYVYMCIYVCTVYVHNNPLNNAVLPTMTKQSLNSKNKPTINDKQWKWI